MWPLSDNLACGLVLTTSSVNGLVYSTNGAKEAAAAGFILLSMVTVRCAASLVLAGPPPPPPVRLSLLGSGLAVRLDTRRCWLGCGHASDV